MELPKKHIYYSYYNNKLGKSIVDIAKDEGVSAGTIRVRIEEFGDPYKCKKQEYFKRAPNTLKWGKKITDIAKDEGVSRSRIYQRIERYGTPFAKEIDKINLNRKYDYFIPSDDPKI